MGRCYGTMVTCGAIVVEVLSDIDPDFMVRIRGAMADSCVSVARSRTGPNTVRRGPDGPGCLGRG